MDSLDISVGLPGREEIHLNLKLDGGDVIKSSRLTGVGGPELLQALEDWRPKFTGSLAKLEVPQGVSAAAILMREVVLKAQGKWNFPFAEEELCHC